MIEKEKKIKEEFISAYDELSEAIFRHCFFRVSNRDVALDLSQETFTRAWKCLSEGQEIDNLRSFLYKIANNLVIDHYRKKKSFSLDFLQEKGFDPASDSHEKIKDDSEMNEIFKTINDLDEPYRKVVRMRHVEGLSPKEIAETLDLTENVVSVRINRGLKKVRAILKTS